MRGWHLGERGGGWSSSSATSEPFGMAMSGSS
jgi:hypothetical protein